MHERSKELVISFTLIIILLLVLSYYNSDPLIIVISTPYLLILSILGILLLLDTCKILSKCLNNVVLTYLILFIFIGITSLGYLAACIYFFITNYMTIHYFKLTLTEMVINIILMYFLYDHIDIYKQNEVLYDTIPKA